MQHKTTSSTRPQHAACLENVHQNKQSTDLQQNVSASDWWVVLQIWIVTPTVHVLIYSPMILIHKTENPQMMNVLICAADKWVTQLVVT